MLRAPPPVRSQLSEALSIVSSHDFPAQWPTLLPQLLDKMQTPDMALLGGVLSTADSIYRRYRGQFMSQQLNEELNYSQKLVRPLLVALQRVCAGMKAAPGPDTAALRVLVSNAQLAASIFFSLNSPGLTDEFEATLDAWMGEFHFLLMLEAEALREADPEKESVVDSLKATVRGCWGGREFVCVRVGMCEGGKEFLCSGGDGGRGGSGHAP
jgi:exportin-2 (importin alpha re-exporter)